MLEKYCNIACVNRENGEFKGCQRAGSLKFQSENGLGPNVPLPDASLASYMLQELSIIVDRDNCIRPDLYIAQAESLVEKRRLIGVEQRIKMVKELRDIM